MSARSPHITLNNRVEMPAIGLGVFQTPPAETVGAVEAAISHQYRNAAMAAEVSLPCRHILVRSGDECQRPAPAGCMDRASKQSSPRWPSRSACATEPPRTSRSPDSRTHRPAGPTDAGHGGRWHDGSAVG